MRNWLLLSFASLALGGVAIFSMHFLGNRAIIVRGQYGSSQLRYAPAIVVASFVLPTVVIFMAFMVMGATDERSKNRWLKLITGGTLGAGAVVGMHYCGQAAVDNFDVQFKPLFVTGSIVIALIATNAALVLFFILRSLWQDSWRRLFGLALLIAAAVTSMHFTAAAGTVYHYRTGPGDVVKASAYFGLMLFVTLVSATACVLLILYAIHEMRKSAQRKARASKIVLVSAIFDADGRILVDNVAGTLPSQLITDTYVEFSIADVFEVGSSMYHWLYTASAHFKLLEPLIPRMRQSISRALRTRSVHDMTRLEFSKLFRQQFCVAASFLAAKLHAPLTDIGLCYDRILTTGGDAAHASLPQFNKGKSKWRRRIQKRTDPDGHVIFLVRHHSEDDRSDTASHKRWRFAPIVTAIPTIANGLNLPPSLVAEHVHDMADNYQAAESGWQPDTTYVAYLGIKARIVGGFEIMVPTASRTTLPSIVLSLGEPGHVEAGYVARMHDLTMVEASLQCNVTAQLDPSFCDGFAHRLGLAIDQLRAQVGHASANEARLLSNTPLRVPCGPAHPNKCATLVIFRHSIPIHAMIANHGFELIDYGIFNRFHQLVVEDASTAFAHQVNVEFQSFATELLEEAGDEDDEYALEPLKDGAYLCRSPTYEEYPSPTLSGGGKQGAIKPLGIFVHEAVSVTTAEAQAQAGGYQRMSNMLPGTPRTISRLLRLHSNQNLDRTLPSTRNASSLRPLIQPSNATPAPPYASTDYAIHEALPILAPAVATTRIRQPTPLYSLGDQHVSTPTTATSVAAYARMHGNNPVASAAESTWSDQCLRVDLAKDLTRHTTFT